MKSKQPLADEQINRHDTGKPDSGKPDSAQPDVSERVRQLEEENRRLRQEVAELQEAAATDALTGIGNRRAFETELAKSLATHARYGLPVTLLLLDVDSLKQVNDQFGHERGDKLLRWLARTIKDSIRMTDHASRIGGDEFAIILPGIDETQATQFVARIRKVLIMGSEWAAEFGFEASVSIGCGTLQDTESSDDFLRRVDRQLYANKPAR